MGRLALRVLFLLFFVLGGITSLVHPVEVIVIDKKTISRARRRVKLLVSLDSNEIIYKDSLRLSLSSTSWSISSWRAVAEEAEGYLAPLKMRKKVYKKSFSILVELEKMEKKKQEKQSALYLSCFVIDANEKLLSVIKQLKLRLF